MNHEQRSCYRTLWDKCIMADGLPKDTAELASAAEYSPASEFEKAVWNKIKKHFYEGSNGRLWVGDLESQWKKDKKLRSVQSKRRKGKRNNKLEESPAVIQGKTETEPMVFGPIHLRQRESPAEIPRFTGMNPAVNGRMDNPSIEPSNESDEEPAEIRRLTESHPPGIPAIPEPEKFFISKPLPPDPEPEITNCKVPREIYLPDAKVNKTSPETVSLSGAKDNEKKTPEVLIRESEFNENLICEPDFDQEDAWRRIAAAYPGNIIHDEPAKALFKQEIVNKHLFRRIQRAVSRYRVKVNEKTAKLVHFMDWFPKWREHEDEAVKK